MSDDNQFGFALFDQLGNVVETELEDSWLVFLIFLGISLSTSLSFSFFLKSGLLVFFSFWAVLCK